ncbi:MAG TPA: acyl-CoA dehydrogenase family protein [Pseudomonadales bacterium]|nr:acyl-CoA dehydrogenase family protein [Pseudomonadales bacterium]
MIEWSEPHKMVRTAVQQFIQAEIVPNLDALEHGDTPPYAVLRKMLKTFGMDQMAKAQFDKMIEREKAIAAGNAPAEKSEGAASMIGKGDELAMSMIPMIELSKYCPGMVTAMGVSMGLGGGAIMNKGTLEQKERWGLDVITMKKICSWAITEPGSGSDAFGSMKSTARRTPDGGYVLNGSKTFITNGPYADVIIFICKLDEPGVEQKDRKVLTFVLDSGMEGLVQSKPLRKMGIHSSPTGELFLQDVKVGPDRLLGGSEDKQSRSGAKETFTQERSGVCAMALGIVERCIELSLDYAKQRVQFGRPIGEFQLIQAKIAEMEVARVNLQNLVFRFIEMAQEGKQMSLAEASASKLYSARTAVMVASEALQIHGGNGYMVEYRVEQLLRDARILQIYGGTDEIQVNAIAKDLLSR